MEYTDENEKNTQGRIRPGYSQAKVREDLTYMESSRFFISKGGIMGKKRGIIFLVIAMVGLLALLPILSDGVFAESATGTKVTYKGAISSMGSTCGKFTVKGHDAFCAEHSEATPPTGTEITSTKLVTDNTMRKALYYGYGGPKAKVNKNDAGWVSTSIALSQANGKGGGTTDAQKFYKSLKDYSKPPESFKVYYCKTEGGYQALCYWIYEPEGELRIKKQSTETEADSSRGYSLADAVYGVYTKKTCTSASRVEKLTTGEKGTSSKVTLDEGTYYIKEMTAPAGFQLSSTVYTVKVTDQCDKTVTVEDVAKKGNLQIKKTSAKPNVTDGKSGYSLAGAKYGVWSDSGLTNSVGELITQENGESNTLPVLAGTYYIKEVSAPHGYLIDDTVHEIQVEMADLETIVEVKVEDVPEEDPAWVIIQKIDAKTGSPIPSGDGELSGAEFTVKYYEGTDWKEDPAKSGAKDKGKWVFKTNEGGFINFGDDERFVSGDELYYNSIGNPTFPIGTITIQETKAPKGYVLNDQVFLVKILQDDEVAGVSLSQIPTTEVKQQPISGDIEIIKTNGSNGKAMKGIAFEVIDVSENRVVATLVTDENGYATTAKPEVPEGSLPYGKYIVREKNAPIGYLPIKDIEVSIDENKEVVTLDIKNTPAEIKTKATFKENGAKEIMPEGNATIVDKVTYKNLRPGATYKLEGILMDKSTGDPLIVDEMIISSEMQFVPEKETGTIIMEFSVKANELSGKDITVFEKLYIDGTVVAEHTDINDENQSVRFNKVGDIEIHKHDSKTGKEMRGVTFEVIDAKAGKVVATLVTDEKGYATTAKKGSVGSLSCGKYIVREKNAPIGYVPIDDIEVDLDENKETITLNIENVPAEIKTSAWFKDNGQKEINPAETITIVDEVSYENLIPGVTYKLSGRLMDYVKEEPLIIRGQEVVAETEFTAEETSGTINMEFVIDGRTLSGQAITVFEYLYTDGTLIASHADINDLNQTVRFLKVGNIEIYKGDSDTGEPLEGVEFEIISEDTGGVVAVLVTDENGYATTADDENAILLYGDYIVRETAPLDGYLEGEDVLVTIDDFNQTMTVKIDNSPIPEVSAKTGDSLGRVLPLAAAMLIISFMGILVSGRRKI